VFRLGCHVDEGGPSVPLASMIEKLVCQQSPGVHYLGESGLAVRLATVSSGLYQEATSLLCPIERAQAERLAGRLQRQTYVLAHAVTRCLLASRLDKPAEELVYKRGRFGKPSLGSDVPQIFFSMSRRPGCFAVGIDSRPLGIDIELCRGNQLDIDSIASRFFTDAELDDLARCKDSGSKIPRFYELWSRKEAVLKAAGVSLDRLLSVDATQKLIPILDQENNRNFYEVHSSLVYSNTFLAVARQVIN
jgi:phosphopantetheine--protein transferase-like protein